MKAPSKTALSGLWKALNAAEATPTGGDFDVKAHREIDAAIAWLRGETLKANRRRMGPR